MKRVNTYGSYVFSTSAVSMLAYIICYAALLRNPVEILWISRTLWTPDSF